MEQKLAAQSALRAAASRLDALQALSARGGSGEALGGAVGSELLRGLEIELARKEGAVAELMTSVGERHPAMRKLRAEVQSLREKVAGERVRIAGAVRGELMQAESLAEGAARAEEAQKAKVLELKHGRDGLQPLLRELASARASYDRALEMYSEYAMHSNLNQTNISLLDPARVPSTMATPSAMQGAVRAFVAGLIFAVGLALLWELVDRRVRGREDLTDQGDVPFLGVVPALR